MEQTDSWERGGEVGAGWKKVKVLDKEHIWVTVDMNNRVGIDWEWGAGWGEEAKGEKLGQL